MIFAVCKCSFISWSHLKVYWYPQWNPLRRNLRMEMLPLCERIQNHLNQISAIVVVNFWSIEDFQNIIENKLFIIFLILVQNERGTQTVWFFPFLKQVLIPAARIAIFFHLLCFRCWCFAMTATRLTNLCVLFHTTGSVITA